MSDIVVDGATVYFGSCLDVLPTLPDNSVDSIVTDPPYELGFMGKKWDASGIAFNIEVWEECLRVLKPGGHLLAFGGSRTWHRLTAAIEDAGFEIRDSIAWLYGSGFPKSLSVSKAIDSTILNGASNTRALRKTEQDGDGDPYILKGRNNGMFGEERTFERKTFSSSTEEGQKWEGWGTALKPAFEPIVVARKPIVGTVAKTVMEYGTGGLNIDGSRIGTEERTNQPAGNKANSNGVYNFSNAEVNAFNGTQATTVSGRWPANVILDEYTAPLVDEQSGISKSTGGRIGKKDKSNVDFGLSGKYEKGDPGFGDVGGASRFFYVAKASKRDRNEGLEDLPTVSASEMVERKDGSAGMDNPRAGAGRTSGAKNFHPTVKPTTLMRYLVKLVTPPGGTVLDPFTGSGSTGKAAILEGLEFVGIEITEDYLPIIEGRLRHALSSYKTLMSKEDLEEEE